jgi:hypothetical protein
MRLRQCRLLLVASICASVPSCWLLQDYGGVASGVSHDTGTDSTTFDSTTFAEASSDAIVPDARAMYLVPNGDFELNALGCGKYWVDDTTYSTLTRLSVDGGGYVCEVCPAPNKPANFYGLASGTDMALFGDGGSYFLRFKTKDNPEKLSSRVLYTVVDRDAQADAQQIARDTITPGETWRSVESTPFPVSAGHQLRLSFKGSTQPGTNAEGGTNPLCFLLDDVELVPSP